MIGAIIGDLAAWTWEHDKECFYKRLVSPDAKLSVYGLLALSMWRTINEGGLIHKNRFYVEIGKALSHADSTCVDLPLEWRRWGQSEYDSPIPFNLKIALIISAFIDSGYLSEERQSQLDWTSFFHGGKQEYYAHFIMTILRRLNEGMTKDEATRDIPHIVFDSYKSGQSHSWHDLLEYTTFAWRCFYYSWDFTSALHNAAKCPANKRLAMFLTGAFADAMYGCSYNMIKQKFVSEHGIGAEWIEIPHAILKSYGDGIAEIRKIEYKNRFFFKKNNALTNVEHHNWNPIDNPYSDVFVDEELRSKVIRAYDTDWEQRYGVYLDNGWFYVYRSHFLLLRFKIQDNHITNLQKSDDPHSRVDDLLEVLHVLKRE
ncbi:MAG: hypothetical protein NC453_23310 [Muribaculum sp.]|nr:hypothetical protein [Muribaculum sp.]